MVKKDLVEDLVRAFPGITKGDMTTVVNTLFESMAQGLLAGESVELRGVGRFKIKQRRARKGRNPKTEAPIDVPIHWAVHFRPGEDLTRRINW
ncbi:MAG: HU family DNA-binding protein [Deltaproteobacteria bacterium]|jgi:integration host factor subunit beta